MSATVLLVYGSGGHNEEMIRLYGQMHNVLGERGAKVNFLSLCDDDVKHFVTKDVIVVPTVTDKYSYIKLFVKMPFVSFKTFYILFKLIRKHKIDFMITTGPGIGVVCALFLKFTNATIISIENSSRFYSKSLTGWSISYLADYFLVQNKELLQIYSKAVYKGRL